MQEQILFYIDHLGGVHSFQNDWWPPSGSIDTFILTNGVLRDTVYLGDSGVDWSTIPDGSVVVAYDQPLQYSWTMTAVLPDGSGCVQMFSFPLDTLNWEMVKVSSFAWMLQPA